MTPALVLSRLLVAIQVATFAVALSFQDVAGLLWHTRRDFQPPIISQSRCGLLASQPAKRVAIIGAGSAGASTAYYLNEFLGGCAKLEFDVYERNDYVGGRTTTVDVYGVPGQAIEVGGSIFVSANRNLMTAVKTFNLPTSGDDDDDMEGSSNISGRDSSPPDLGVWDGHQFVYVQPADESLWKTVGKLLWKYGTSPVRTQLLVQSTVNRFLQMYDAPYFPWTTLTDTIRAVGLDPATSVTGAMYLEQNSISPPFSTDLIQALTRVNYAQNLNQIHGLETMVSMAASGGTAVIGGNWQIFAEMLRRAKADVWLNKTVTKISKCCDGEAGREKTARRFTVTSHDEADGTVDRCYHDVVLAAPYQYSGISLYNGAHVPAKIDYVEMHVTLFATPYSLSPDYFGIDPAPLAVLTTLPDSLTVAENRTGPTPFFSVSTLRTVINPETGGTEFVYKIFSPSPVTDELLAKLLLPASAAATPGITAEDALISWKYEKVWNSYPYEIPRVKFEEFVLDDGLWYTSGIEGFISTMETSSLSGMNVAASMKNAWGYPYNSTEQAYAEL